MTAKAKTAIKRGIHDVTTVHADRSSPILTADRAFPDHAPAYGIVSSAFSVVPVGAPLPAKSKNTRLLATMTACLPASPA